MRPTNVIIGANERLSLLQNIRSKLKKIAEFVETILKLDHRPILTCLTEIWLNGSCNTHCFE